MGARGRSGMYRDAEGLAQDILRERDVDEQVGVRLRLLCLFLGVLVVIIPGMRPVNMRKLVMELFLARSEAGDREVDVGVRAEGDLNT